MRAYEKDKEVKIPGWYMKLPIGIMEKICEIAMRFAKMFPSKKKKKTKGNIRFYI